MGIVGARSATPYGTQVATDLGYALARREFAVVSGGAYGIDSAAHRGALAAGGPTVLVSAGGVDRPYPPSSAGLFDRAAEHGAVISESPPGSAPHRQRFLTRNRLIAALSTGTVIVEAAARSGAMNTARHCERLRPAADGGARAGHVRDLGRVPQPAARRSAARHASSPRPDDVVDLIGAAGDVTAPA